VPSPNHLPDLGDRGARHPSKTPTTRSGLGGEIHHGLATTKRAGPTPEYKLTSYSAWWKRMERLEGQFYKEVAKEEVTRKNRKDENLKKEEGKKEFVRKFFPSCVSSPGGKVYLKGLPDIDSTGRGDVGKRNIDRSTIPVLNFNFQHTLEAKGKVKTSINNHQKEPVIEAFVRPLIAHTADTEKVGNLVIRTHLGQKKV
jgi:hypothetical protein